MNNEISGEPLNNTDIKPTILFSTQEYIGTISKDNYCELLQSGPFGTLIDDKYVFTPIECMYLLFKNKIHLIDEKNNSLTMDDILKIMIPVDNDIWTKFLVFIDLKSRGYSVKQGYGPGISFRLYSRGSKSGDESAKMLIYILTDGDSISLDELDRITKLATSSRKKLVFALINPQGEITYYKVSQVPLSEGR